MKLLNFELSQPSFSIELIGLGFIWDLHNAATFLGTRVNPNDNTAVMSWKVKGQPAIKFRGCRLVFQGLKLMVVSPRDEELPYSEDLCVSGISKLTPDHAEDAAHRTKHQCNPSDPV